MKTINNIIRHITSKTLYSPPITGRGLGWGLLLLCLTACVDEYKYEPVAADNHGIYLAADKTEYVLSEQEEGTIEFTVLRHDTVSAGTYALACSDASVSVPSTVSFAAGQKSQTVAVGFDLPVGTLNKKVVISAAPADAYLYGEQAQTISLNRCHSTQGRVRYYIIDWVEEMYSAHNETRTICDMGEKGGTHTYMIKGMYESGLDIKFTINEKGDVAIDEQPAYHAILEEGSDEKHIVTVYGIGKRDEKTGVITLNTMFSVEGVGYYTMQGETIEMTVD